MRLTKRQLALTAALGALLVLAFVSVAGASKGVVGHFGGFGLGPNQFNNVGNTGIAVNSAGNGSGADAGDVYSVDQGTSSLDGNAFVDRVEQFDQYGNYKREWGWDIVDSGPDDSGANEQQTITVPGSVTAGTFTLTLKVATGTATASSGDTQLAQVKATAGLFRVGDVITSSLGGIPANTTITAIDRINNTMDLSAQVTGNLGTLSDLETTQPINYNANANTGTGADNLQESLEALPAIGSGDLTVSGGPGATNPFEVTFSGGELAGDDVLPLAATGSLTGGVATVSTVANGGGFEVCNATDVCKYAVDPQPPGPNVRAAGSLADIDGIAVEPSTGNVLITGNRRVNVYGSDGTFQGAFGWGVKPGDSGPFSLDFCTTATGCQIGNNGPAGETAEGIVAVDPSSGDVFTELQNRITEFSLSHDGSGAVTGASIVRAFGGDAVASGPDDTGTNEQQTVTIPGTVSSGTFKLRIDTATFARFDGTTFGVSGTNTLVLDPPHTTSGVFKVGDFITSSGGGIPALTTITAVDPTTGTVSLSNNLTSNIGNANVTAFEQTSSINHNANANTGTGADNLQESLEALPIIGVGNVAVSGGPGGTAPFTIDFTGGTSAHDDIPQMIPTSSMTGGSASVSTDINGGGFEVCDAGADVCKLGSQGASYGGQLSQPISIAIDSHGVLYVMDDNGGGQSNRRVQSFTPPSYTPALFDPTDIQAIFNGSVYVQQPAQIASGPNDHLLVLELIGKAGVSTCPDGSPSVVEYRILDISPGGANQDTYGVCGRITGFEIAANTVTGNVYVPGNQPAPGGFGSLPLIYAVGENAAATDSLDTITPTTSGAVITGKVNPNGPDPNFLNGPATLYQLEYKRSVDSNWTSFGNPINSGGGFVDRDVTIHLGGLDANTYYDVRLVASKAGLPNVYTAPQTFQSLPVAPTVDALSSSGVTTSSADLQALINAHGTDTTYHFEYGTSTQYGHSTPETNIGSSLSAQAVTDHIDNLQTAVYHFRVVAHNALGTTTSGDQTFTFYPPPCPNQTLRQQNGSAYLPDCRAYELVSPADAGNVILRSAPWTASPYANAPARFGFAGGAGIVNGTNPPNGADVDTYLATRTDSGWITKYPGIPGDQGTSSEYGGADPGLNNLLFFNTFQSFVGTPQPFQNAPHLFNADGDPLGRWPANIASISGGESTEGVFQPSPDFSHMALSSNNIDFDPDGHGLINAPGSAYDYNVATGTTTLISKTAGGADIPQEPGNTLATGEFIRFPGDDPNSTAAGFTHPGVSTDGSHILMSTQAHPDSKNSVQQTVLSPTRLYMSVNDAVHYDVSAGHDVNYVGMTSDGTKVFFISDEDLTSDNTDTDSSTDLYMWEENGNGLGAPTITDISKGSGGTGNSDDCVATWISKCKIALLVGSGGEYRGGSPSYVFGLGNTASTTHDSDYPIATNSGDVYFYSPELLDGPANGFDNGQNLYVYRNGAVHFVASLKPDGSKSVTSFNVSPDGAHAAFVTNSKLTSYDNAGFREMYSFDPSTGIIVCVSCRPNGDPPTIDVGAAKTGLFMANDGRTFFSTADPLVAQDTNAGTDVYEYVDGRPQLITSGIGATHTSPSQKVVPQALEAVSANGVDVYFSTFETLVTQDHNGDFLKFYDARTGGGFAPSAISQPCVAADECHGEGSASPPAPAIASRGDLGSGGSAVVRRLKPHRKPHKKHEAKKRHHKKRKQHQKRHTNANRGGAK